MDSSFKSSRLMHPILKYILAFVFMVGVAFAYVEQGQMVYTILLGIPLIVGYIAVLFRWPVIGLYTAMIISFLIPALNRFVKNLPYGFIIEATLLGVYIILFFKYFKRLDFKFAKNDIVLVICIWMIYILLQVANPWAVSIMAWAYAMRGIALLQFLLIPMVFVLLKEHKDLKHFLFIYFVFSCAAILWGTKQQLFGLSEGETRWLNLSGAYKTHLIFGKLRVFSYYFDAGTYGAAMGQLCIISALLYLGPFKKFFKYIFLAISIGAFYGMMISGTRGAIAIPAAGGMVYVILIRNIKYIAIAAAVLAFGFVFLKFTSIGNSNYSVNRLRTALNPEDASLNVRIRNRALLTQYLKDKPFGGGVGSAGSWGQKFSPNTWLANFPPDGLYTRIRAETGIVGYIIYLVVWLYILYRGFKVCWSLKNPQYKSIATAFLAGYAGILVSNYGNEVMTQFPNNFVTFISLAFIFILERWDKEQQESGEMKMIF